VAVLEGVADYRLVLPMGLLYDCGLPFRPSLASYEAAAAGFASGGQLRIRRGSFRLSFGALSCETTPSGLLWLQRGIPH
jgi:hypothetical protein